MILKTLAYEIQDDLLPEKWEIEHILPVKWENSYDLRENEEVAREKIEHLGNKTPFEKKLNMMFSIQAFTSLESLKTYLEHHEIEVLLISTHAITRGVEEMMIPHIYILSEGEVLEAYKEYPTIYKYQSSELVMKEALSYYTNDSEDSSYYIQKKKTQIIGVYSPIHRSYKTTFALALGQVLAERYRVLYMNLEEYSGFEELLQRESSRDLSDAFYYMKIEKGGFYEKLHLVIQSLGKLDYIPPMLMYKDLMDLESGDWAELIGGVAKHSGYERIIVDFSDCTTDLFKQLALCDRIFVPTKEDKISKAKLCQFEKILEYKELHDLQEQLIKIRIPFVESLHQAEFWPESFQWGELGEYVRKLALEKLGEDT